MNRECTLRRRHDVSVEQNQSHGQILDVMPDLLALRTASFVSFLSRMDISASIGERGARVLGNHNRRADSDYWPRIEQARARLINQEIRSATVSIGNNGVSIEIDGIDEASEGDFVDDGSDFTDDPQYMGILEDDEASSEPDWGERVLSIILDGDTASPRFDDYGILEDMEPGFDDDGPMWADLPLRDLEVYSNYDSRYEGLQEEMDGMQTYNRGIIDTHELYLDGICPVHAYHALRSGVLLGSNDDINFLRSPRAYWPVIEAA